jgi:hypothetical protein
MYVSYIFKHFVIIAIIFEILTFNLHAALPEITNFFPKIVNTNSANSMVIIAENINDSITVTINGVIVQSIINTEANMITCTVPQMSTSDSVKFTIQNDDGISDFRLLSYADCSSLNIDIPETIGENSIELAVSNECYTAYQYQLDSEMFSPYIENSEPIRLTGLNEGVHVLKIRGRDLANNISNLESHTFNVNVILPEIQLNNLPKTITTKTSESITVTSVNEDTAYYQYKLIGDVSISEPISSFLISEPIILTSLTQQSYTICVVGGDKSGYWQTFEHAICHNWKVIDISISQQSLTPVEVLAGTESMTYTTTYTGNDAIISWSVQNSNGDQIGETVYGNAFSFTPPETGAYAGIYTISMEANADGLLIDQKDILIKVPFTIETNQYNIIEKTIFIVKGIEAGATLIWSIYDDNGILPNPEQIGRWERVGSDSLDMTFYPASVETITPFRVNVSVENDPDLSAETGLQKRITDYYNIIPITQFSITLSDENGTLSTTTNNDITVKDMVMLKTKNLTTSYSKVVFDLPDSGGTYHFKIKDNRTPPVYMDFSFSTTLKENIVILQPVGSTMIDGSVENTGASALNDVTVAAYLYDYSLSFFNTYYQTRTDESGRYELYLPDDISTSNWTVIAAQEGYVSSVKTDQLLNTEINFSGTDALQAKTTIMMIYPIGQTINIRANPPFEDKKNQIDILRLQSDGSEDYYDQVDCDDNGLITVATPDVDQYTLIIMADTVENDDPNTGYIAYHAYRENSSDHVIEREDMTMDLFGGTMSLVNDDQVMKVFVPVNGITTQSTITIEQIEKSTSCNATKGSKYLYVVSATNSQTGTSITSDEINRLMITLPFNLRDIQPGDLENGQWLIYAADSVEKMESHQTEIISVNNFQQSNYLGDGKMGSISFWVDHLTVFAIGKPADVVPSTPQRTVIKKDEGGDCFIGIHQHFIFSKFLGLITLLSVLCILFGVVSKQVNYKISFNVL